MAVFAGFSLRNWCENETRESTSDAEALDQ